MTIDEEAHQFTRHSPVGGQGDGHAWEGAQHGDVVKGVVGGTERAVSYASGDAEDGDGVLAIGQVDLDLFQGTCDIEAGRAATEDFLAGMGESGSDADGVLFGNAALDELCREGFCEVGEGD